MRLLRIVSALLIGEYLDVDQHANVLTMPSVVESRLGAAQQDGTQPRRLGFG